MPAVLHRPFPVLLLAAALALGGGEAARAQGAAGGRIPLAEQAEGATIGRVRVDLRASGGSRERDEALLGRLRRSLAPLEGARFNRQIVEARLAPIRARMGEGRIAYRLQSGGLEDALTLVVELDTSQKAEAAAGFPTLYQSERAQVSAIVSGGFGLYSDRNPWFGKPLLFNAYSPIAKRLPGSGPAWTEGYIEPGLSAMFQLGDAPVWAYAAFTYMTTLSRGQDIFRNDSRSYGAVEKGYGGLLYVDPDSGDTLNVSVGRQNFTLNDGFLVNLVRGSSNAGARGATYLGPRLANDFSAIADARFGPWRLKAFYIDPNELEFLESRTTFAGANVGYDVSKDLSLDTTAMAIPQSKSTFSNPFGLRLPKEGLVTIAGHAKQRNAFGVNGVWLEGEFAHQTHPDYAMSAWAGYALAGYRFANAPWTPSISYRYALFSGDDPLTRRYERFDSLLSTGLGIWLQGISFGKLTSNSNLETHRIQFNVAPIAPLNLTFDWHLLRAPELENRGGNPALQPLASRNLGQEFTLSARWAINRNLYLQAIASHARPGSALKQIGADKPWSTFQASLYWSL